MGYPYGPEPYLTFGTVEGNVDEPERFPQDLFGDKRQSHSFLNRSGQ